MAAKLRKRPPAPRCQAFSKASQQRMLRILHHKAEAGDIAAIETVLRLARAGPDPVVKVVPGEAA